MITFEFVFKIILQILLVFDVVVVILSVFFPFFFLFKPILTGAITVDKDKQLVKVSCMSLFSWGYITAALLYDLLTSNLSIISDIGYLILFSIIQILFFVFMGMVLKKYKIFISEVLTFFNYSPE